MLVRIRTLTLRLLHSAHPFLDFRCALRRTIEPVATGDSFIGETGLILGNGAGVTLDLERENARGVSKISAK